MKFLRYLLLGFLVILFVPTAFLAVVLVSASSYTPAYDQSDPDYAHFAKLFAELSASHDRRGKVIDLRHLRKGEWKAACVFGGYANPLETMRGLGAINEKDIIRFTEAGRRGFRLSPIEESEAAIAYVDLDENAHFIHFKNGMGSGGQYFRQCVSKPETKLVLGNR